MIPAAPQTVKNDFFRQLKKLSDEDKYRSVRRYYDSFHLREFNIDELAAYKNIDKRVDHSRYFFFPTESDIFRMNCFEKSASVYFALRELYPESNPALVYLFYEDGSMHTTTLFTHKGELHSADPNYNIFGKIQLLPNMIVIPPESSAYLKEDAPEEAKRERTEKFKDLLQINDNLLDQSVVRLRSQAGIVNFVYQSGQKVAEAGVFDPEKTLFMYVTEGRDITSELRLGSNCIRFVCNPFQKQTNMELLRYQSAWWRGIKGEENLAIPNESPYPSANLESLLCDRFPVEGVAHYIKHVMHKPFSFEEVRQFEQYPTVQQRFGEVIEEAKKFSAATYFNLLNFLRYKFGPASQIPPLKTHHTAGFINPENGKEAAIEMPLFEDKFEAMYLKEILKILQFTEDAQRYSQETAKQLIN